MTDKNQQLYVVRGSGYAIDSALVEVDTMHEVDGERYAAVRPAAPRHVGEKSILVHERYLQPVDERLKKYIYTIVVTKQPIGGGAAEQDILIIDGAFRNMAVKTIIKRLESELGPILRLE